MLFKTATAVETAARIDTVVMDKTGTLTRGEPVSIKGAIPRIRPELS